MPIIGPILGAIVGVWIYECYAMVIRNYGQFSDTKHKREAEIGREAIQTEDDAPELRQQLTVDADWILVMR